MTPKRSPSTDRRTPPKRRHRNSKLYGLFHGQRTLEELENEQDYLTAGDHFANILKDAALDRRLPPAFVQ